MTIKLNDKYLLFGCAICQTPRLYVSVFAKRITFVFKNLSIDQSIDRLSLKT